MSRTTSLPLLGALLGALTAACGGPEPLFPEDYEATFTEVRDCRQSGDHDLHTIRVLADEAALMAYADRDGPFPPGATVLKVEYDFGDIDCTGPIQQWTVMQKLPVGTAVGDLDWEWQTVDADRNVIAENPTRCPACHQGCGQPPDGYDGTCTIP